MAAKSKERDRDTKLASGTQAHLSNLASLKIDGTDYTIPDILARLGTRIGLLDQATTARVDLKKAVTAEKLDRPTFNQFVSGFRDILLGMYRNDPKTLADFGLAPHKTTKPKVETKATAIQKSAATREARHTMGKKQKKEIKGVLPAPAPEPSPAPAPAPSPAPAPAPAPAPSGNGAAPAPVTPAQPTHS